MFPKMVMFDYGGTLIKEAPFDALKGDFAMMKYATLNPDNLTPLQIQQKSDEVNREIGRFNESKRHLQKTEYPFSMFCAYLYESLGIGFSLPYEALEEVFWDNASEGYANEGAAMLLDFLRENGIGTAVISNLSYSEKSLTNRLNRLLPENSFDFVITSSTYLFRKPSRRIFEVALRKAGLSPDEVIYVGDSFECDVIGAQNAGITPVWLTDSKEKTDVLKITKLTDLIDIIKMGCRR